MKDNKVPVQSLIDHIKTAIDVDPWAKEMAEELLNERETAKQEIEGGGSTWWYVCSECHTAVDKQDKYCRQCGKLFVS